MTTRRLFVKRVTTGLAATMLAGDVVQGASGSPMWSQDEAFWKTVRAGFPLTEKRVYFNNGTFGPSPTRVLDAIKKRMDHIGITGEYGNTDRARHRLAEFVKVAVEEISLTHNTTAGINIITWGLPLKAGDEVLITRQEHVGNALPWLNRAKLHGIVLKPFEPAPTAEANLDIIRQLTTSRTRVIAIPHITCTHGLKLPIQEISAWARSKNIFTAIDGAHGPGSLNLDLKALGCDFYATSCHKWMLGPSGTGFLYVRKDLIDTLQAYWLGAYSDKGWDLQTTPTIFKGYAESAHRYDFGSQNAALYAGVEEAVDFLEEIGMDKVEARIKALSSRLQQNLLTLGSKIEMLTPTDTDSRAGMITFRIPGKNYMEFSTLAAKNLFRIRAVPESNLNALRISTHIYNNFDEVDRFTTFVAASV
jgi:cysteine desulfurase/selenocysteine lyase